MDQRYEQIAEAVRARICAPEVVTVLAIEPEQPGQPGRWQARSLDTFAMGSWFVDGFYGEDQPHVDIHVEVSMEFSDALDIPTDSEVVTMVDRLNEIEEHLGQIHVLLVNSLERGDAAFAIEARDLMPALIADVGSLLAAMNAAIATAE